MFIVEQFMCVYYIYINMCVNMYVHALKIGLGEHHLGFPPFSKKLSK